MITSNYNFNNLTNINEDECYQTARDVQNNTIGHYRTQNYFLSFCGMKQPIKFATNQPAINFKGGYGICGAGGCNIDSDSELKIGALQTHSLMKLNLNPRQFLTVPLLKRGPPQPFIESRLQQGACLNDLKSCKTIMDKSFDNVNLMPLIPSIKSNIQNPIHLIENAANPRWVRGGISTRELTHKKKYLEKNFTKLNK